MADDPSEVNGVRVTMKDGVEVGLLKNMEASPPRPNSVDQIFEIGLEEGTPLEVKKIEAFGEEYIAARLREDCGPAEIIPPRRVDREDETPVVATEDMREQLSASRSSGDFDNGSEIRLGSADTEPRGASADIVTLDENLEDHDHEQCVAEAGFFGDAIQCPPNDPRDHSDLRDAAEYVINAMSRASEDLHVGRDPFRGSDQLDMFRQQTEELERSKQENKELQRKLNDAWSAFVISLVLLGMAAARLIFFGG